MAELTPFQTVGPFFEIAIPGPGDGRRAESAAIGKRIRIDGTVRDGGGTPVPDALIETWQADTNGRYAAGDQIAHTIGRRPGRRIA